MDAIWWIVVALLIAFIFEQARIELEKRQARKRLERALTR